MAEEERLPDNECKGKMKCAFCLDKVCGYCLGLKPIHLHILFVLVLLWVLFVKSV